MYSDVVKKGVEKTPHRSLFKASGLTDEELSRLLDKYAPRSGFSAELGCRYFTVKSREETLFAIYDTPETFRKRVTEADCETVFLEDRSVTDYLGGRLLVAP